MGLPEPAAAGADEITQEWLEQAPVTALERIRSGSNAVFRIDLETPAGPRAAIYKPARGERPLWDFPTGTLHRREVAAHLVDRALGWSFTPLTVLRREAPLGPGSVQALVPEPGPDLVLEQARMELQLRGLAALDVLINNADRKRAHLLVDPGGELRAIDHGVTFHREFKLRTVLLELGGSEVPREALAAISSLLADPARLAALRRRLRRLLDAGEVEAFELRARELVGAGRYPRLNEWYGRPFEW